MKPRRFPYPPLARGLVLRGVVLWLLIRCAVAMLIVTAGAGMGQGASPLRAGGPLSVAVIALAAGLATLDAWASRELRLHANLGLSGAWAPGLAAAGAAVAELVIVMIGIVVA